LPLHPGLALNLGLVRSFLFPFVIFIFVDLWIHSITLMLICQPELLVALLSPNWLWQFLKGECQTHKQKHTDCPQGCLHCPYVLCGLTMKPSRTDSRQSAFWVTFADTKRNVIINCELTRA
jgi:hypothetical protein